MRFYLFDRVLQFESGKEATGVKNVSSQEEFLLDHYAKRPVMPEPLIIESLAQLGGWTLTVSSQYAYLAVMVMVKNIKVSGVALPGDQIMLHVSIEDINEYGATVACTAKVDSRLILQVGSITYVLYELPEQDRAAVKKQYEQLRGAP